MSEPVAPRIQRFPGGPFGENGYVVWCPETNEGILIDPGAAVHQMLEAVATESVRVGAIVLTHAHIDHVDGLAAAKDATGASIHLHRADEPLYRQAPIQAQWFGLELGELPPVDEYLNEGSSISFGACSFEVFHAPGHAPGHVVLVGPGLAIVGDCVFAGSIGRTDLPGGDLKTLMDSIRRHILSLPDETVLYSGHGPETTVGHERVANPFLAPHFGGSRFA